MRSNIWKLWEEPSFPSLISNITHNCKVSYSHPQLRNTMKFIPENSFVYSMEGSLIEFNLENQKSMMLAKSLEESNSHENVRIGDVVGFFVSNNFLFWALKYESRLFCKRLKDISKTNKEEEEIVNKEEFEDYKDIYTVRCKNGYRINSMCVTACEKFVFTVGQTNFLTLFSFSGDQFKELWSTNMKSFGNDVSISKCERYVCTVTDELGYFIYEFFHNENEVNVELIMNEVTDMECDMCCFNLDSTRVVISNCNTIILVDLRTMRRSHSLKVGSSSVCRFSPSSSLVFCYVVHSKHAVICKINEETNEVEKYPIKPRIKQQPKNDDDNGMSSISRTQHSPLTMDFSSDGSRVLVAYRSPTGDACVLEGTLSHHLCQGTKEKEMLWKLLHKNVEYSDVLIKTQF